MKTTQWIAAAGLLLAICTQARAQTPDFSGQWKRNDAQSDAGDLSPNSVPVTVEIRQFNGLINIHTVVKDAKGVLHPSNDTLSMDGTIKTITNNNSQIKRSASVIWSADKKSFVYKISITGPDGKVIQDWKEVFNLTNEGKSLQVDVDITLGDDSHTLKEMFDKA